MKGKYRVLLVILTIIVLAVLFFFTFIKFSFGSNMFSHGDRNSNQIALTFDDGPSPETIKILEILKEHNVTATFFLIGKNIEQYPEITDLVIRSGNEVGSHSYTHKSNLIFFEDGELNKTDYILKQHNLTNRLFRPPYGLVNIILYWKLNKLGYKTILYDLPSRDYSEDYSSERVSQRVLKLVENGSIIDFHDPLLKDEEVLKKVLPELKKQYKLVNVSTLISNN
jgi:peptidoglycan/xylan/chitin deacetylase (PgdA/CDA1 family)